MFETTRQENGFTIIFSASFEAIDAVCEELERFLSNACLSGLCFDVNLGVREALTNAVRHGSNSDPKNTVRISIKLVDSGFYARIADSGPGFDWRKQARDVPLSSTSGRGLLILKQYFDVCRFNEPGNEVELVKYKTEEANE